jgi:hypothetical protein
MYKFSGFVCRVLVIAKKLKPALLICQRSYGYHNTKFILHYRLDLFRFGFKLRGGNSLKRWTNFL